MRNDAMFNWARCHSKAVEETKHCIYADYKQLTLLAAINRSCSKYTGLYYGGPYVFCIKDIDLLEVIDAFTDERLAVAPGNGWFFSERKWCKMKMVMRGKSFEEVNRRVSIVDEEQLRCLLTRMCACIG